jgi:resuscitation-promoting factor RpfB
LLRSVKYGLCSAVLAGLVGGTVAWTSTDKTVHLLVDGRSTTISTTASDVTEALRAAGYHVGPHDLVAPSPTSAVHDHATIVLKRGRLLRLDINGTDRSLWTTAVTVDQAMDQLGFSTADFTSVSRSRRLPLAATDIEVRTPRHVTVAHDGRTTALATTAATVGQLLRDIDVTLGPDDRLNVALSAAPTSAEQITVTRVDQHNVTTETPIPFATHKRNDPSLTAGRAKVVTAGRKGVRAVTWAVVYVDGRLAGRTRMGSAVVRRPTARVVRIGTKDELPASDTPNTPHAPLPSPGSAQAIARSLLADYGWSADQFDCLDQMWNRESGWRVNAQNPSGAYGIPQALPGSKMASAGPDWQTDARTQIKWGLGYVKSRYSSPCQAWSLWQSQGWY